MKREQKGNIMKVVGISFTTPLIPENHVKGGHDHDNLWNCIYMNSTKNNTEYKEWVWKWENGTHRMMFDTFWSVINRTGENYQHCIWKRKQQLWRCKSEIMKGGPLGPEDVKYFLAVDYRVRLFLEENPALRGHYWICGQTTYTHLPLNWGGVCYIGLVRPKFFFLPESGKWHLGVPLYDDLVKRKRNIDTSFTHWKCKWVG